MTRRRLTFSRGTDSPLDVRDDGAVSQNRPVADLLVPGFSIDALERELIHAAIEKARGNKTLAARMLGITRRRLYSRLDSFHGRRERGDD